MEHISPSALMASTSSRSGIRSGTRDKNGLCILSLDGGGVRGLSTLLILKRIMQQTNAKRQLDGLSPVKPCDVFDLIGGTSTGGLIAIMLGRLQMDIQPCIDAYSELSSRIFCKAGLPVDLRGEVKGRYKASELEAAVKKMIVDSGLAEDAPLNDGKDRSCRVFVCAVRKENKAVARIRAYQSNRALVEDRATIWEAARATSAASGFFDPISIGQHGQEYVDAGLGCNNPVEEVWTEAQDIWCPTGDDLAALVRCFISIGTGNPGTSPIGDSAWKMFLKTLTAIVTETERTAETFERRQRGLFDRQRCFRFNVDQGLQKVGLEEYQKSKEIMSATSEYMESQRMQTPTRRCSEAIEDKEFWKGDSAELKGLVLREHQQGREKFQLVFSLAAAPEIDYFVGRASNLRSIESVFSPFTAAKRETVVLHGLGGIGKSQLAIEFAKQHRTDYTAVLWLNAKTEDTLKRSFAANARRLPKDVLDQELLYGPQDEEALSTILREMKAWLCLPGNDRWLLIYDNVDNPKIPDNKSEHAFDIESYFPEAHQGSILVTTRWETLRIGPPLEVAKLSKDEESLSLLARMSGRTIGEDPRTKDLLRKLDGLPLALATAGGYLRLTGIPVSEYLHLYDTSWLELQRTSPHVLSYENQTIFSTWNLSYIHIRNENESAAHLLELWAYFDNRDLWYDLLKAGEDDAPEWFLNIIRTKLAFNSVLGTLRKHALIEHLTESDGYSMHHCVHAWVKNVLCTASESQNLKLALNCVGFSVPFGAAPGDWTLRQRVLPHAERFSPLLRVNNEASKDSEEIDDCITHFSGNLGDLYDRLDKLDEAELMYQRALAGYQKVLEPDHPRILETINNLSNVFRLQGRLAEAESMTQRALDDYGKVLGPDHLAVMNTMETLGKIYGDQGKLTEAESIFQRALTGQEKTVGKNHSATLETMSSLGTTYLNQGKLTEAESMFHRALTGQEKTLKQNHSSTLETMSDLGTTYLNQGKLTEAESMFHRALTGQEKTLKQNHSPTLFTMSDLGATYLLQGKLMEAESMFQRALAGCTNIAPPNTLQQLDLFYNMGLLSQDLKDFERAKEFFSQAHEGYQELLGSQHPLTIDALRLLNEEIERNTEGATRGADGQGYGMETDRSSPHDRGNETTRWRSHRSKYSWAGRFNGNSSIFSIWPWRRSHRTGLISMREVTNTPEGASSGR